MLAWRVTNNKSSAGSVHASRSFTVDLRKSIEHLSLALLLRQPVIGVHLANTLVACQGYIENRVITYIETPMCRRGLIGD